MAHIQAGDIDDMVIATQKELGPLKVTDAAAQYQDYVAWRTLLKKHRVEFKGTYGFKWNVRVRYNDSAQHIGHFAVDDVNVVDVLKTAEVPICKTTANFAYDAVLMNMNQGPNQVVDMLKEGRASAMGSLIELVESSWWGAPSSSSDNVTPYGADYWIVSSATTGFYGANPTGFADCAGIDADEFTTTRNYTGRYVNKTADDLLAKWEEACVRTEWRKPVGVPDYSTSEEVGFYMPYAVRAKTMEIMRLQNDRLGRDLAWGSMQEEFRGVPLTFVPQLEDDDQEPVIGIHWGDFTTIVLSGWFLKESEPKVAAHQHTVREVFIDLVWNTKCTNRRRQFRIDKA